jgi:hypothetical protein
MFSRAQNFIDRAESVKQTQNWMKSIENLNLSAVPEETAPSSPQKAPLPDFESPPGLIPMARDSNEVYRLEQMLEVESIK